MLDDGVFLPHIKREPGDLIRGAELDLTGPEREILLSGWERPRTQEGENAITQKLGESLTLRFDAPKRLETLRLRFDPDFGRKTVSENLKMRVFAMKLHTGLDFKPVKTAATIVKSFAVYADGERVYFTNDNYLSLVRIPLNLTAKELRIEWLATHGAETVRLFSVDVSGTHT